MPNVSESIGAELVLMFFKTFDGLIILGLMRRDEVNRTS